jgi:hypothetical protein
MACTLRAGREHAGASDAHIRVHALQVARQHQLKQLLHSPHSSPAPAHRQQPGDSTDFAALQQQLLADVDAARKRLKPAYIRWVHTCVCLVCCQPEAAAHSPGV